MNDTSSDPKEQPTADPLARAMPVEHIVAVRSFLIPFELAEFVGWKAISLNRHGTRKVQSIHGARTALDVVTLVLNEIVREDQQTIDAGGVPPQRRLIKLWAVKRDGEEAIVFDATQPPSENPAVAFHIRGNETDLVAQSAAGSPPPDLSPEPATIAATNGMRMPQAVPDQRTPEQPTKGKAAMSKKAKALAALADNPEWTDEMIAEAAGCHVKSLYRWNEYTRAREILREGRKMMPTGTKDKDSGDVEAWDEPEAQEDDDE